MTLLYGYKAVKYFSERSTEISYLELENKIKGDVDKTKSDTYGTVKKSVLTIPGKYRQICFVTSFGTQKYPDNINTGYNLLDDNVKISKDKNLFLAPPGDIGFNVGDIAVYNGRDYDCVDIVGNKVILRLESMGDHVKVSQWQ